MHARSLGERLGAELAAKTAMLLAMAAGVVVPYFGLQRWRPFPPREPFVTPLDALVPFSPDWAPAYLSVCLLVPLFPLLAQQREDVWRFGRGIFWLCLPCFAFFLLAPMRGPRPAAAAGDGLYGWLIGVDATWNSFPSLHAGLVVFSFLYGWRVLGGAMGKTGRRVLALASLAWAAAILYGTLATKQHWLADLPAAFVLAFAAHRRAWRGAARSAASAPASSDAVASRAP
jgi:hypothetical protein